MSKSIVEAAQQIIELSQLPKKWTWSDLGDLGIVRLGKTPRKVDYRDHGDYKIVKFRDVDETGKIDWDKNEKGYVSSSPKILGTLQDLREGDVLVTASAHMSEHIGKKVGIVLSVPRKYKNAFVVGELLRIRTKNCVDPRWVFYYLGSAEGYKAIQRRVHGVHLIGSRAQHIEVPVAPPDQQVLILWEIEKQFSRLDEAVTSLKRVKVNLKRYKAAVIKAAVEGKLTEDWRTQHPNVEPAGKLLDRILAERRAKWQSKGKYYEEAAQPDTSTVGPLPELWIWASVDQLSNFVTDGDHNPPIRVQDGVPHLTAKHIKGWRISFRDCSYISLSDYERTRSRFEPQPGDLIVTCVGTVGQTAIVPAGITFSADRNLAGIRLVECGMTPKFLQIVLNSPEWQLRMTQASGFTAQPHLYLGDLRTLPIPLPPLIEQQFIIAEVERRLSVIEELQAAVEANLTRADRLRQSVLRQAFDGKLISP